MLLSTRMTFASYGIGKKRCPRLDATCSQLEDVTHDKGVVQFSSGEVAVSSPRPGGGTLGYFLGGYVRPGTRSLWAPAGTPNWHPVLKKVSPKTDTPF